MALISSDGTPRKEVMSLQDKPAPLQEEVTIWLHVLGDVAIIAKVLLAGRARVCARVFCRYISFRHFYRELWVGKSRK